MLQFSTGRRRAEILGISLTAFLLTIALFPAAADACSCSSDPNFDNFCYHAPSTSGCGMTYPGGYCDPNGNGSYDDADWVRGYNEYQAACSGGGGTQQPDVYIEDLWWSPSNPQPGQQVQFHVRVRNGGNAGTGADVGVGYFVNGSYVGYGIRGAMFAGEVSSSFGMVQRWTAQSGSFTISALVDDINRFAESNEGNNSRAETLSIGGGTSGACPAGEFDIADYVLADDPGARVYSRLYDSTTGQTYDEVFAYRDGGTSYGLDRWFFVKNTSGYNWEEFGFDSQFVYRYRDSSWANVCQENGAAAYYALRDSDRSAFARWAPRCMYVGEEWWSPVQHFVDAGYKRTNSCSLSTCTSQYEGWPTANQKLVAHHSSYTTIWGYTINDVIELSSVSGTGDRFFYSKQYGLVGFEGPNAGDQGRFESGAYSISASGNGTPAWVGLCGQ